MRKSNPDSTHQKLHSDVCGFPNLFDNLCANTGTQAHTQTAKHQLVRSHPADRTGYRLLFYLWRGGEARP